jgi:phosphoglucosamine mutase
VGDRHVVQKMRTRGAVLGGEESGHIVFLGRHTTGDGILSGLMLLAAMAQQEKPLSELARLMTVFPQTLVNVTVESKPEISAVPALSHAIEAAEETLGGNGRVLVRYSGTEPVCRIMVEGRDQEEIDNVARKLAAAVQETLGVGRG